MMEQVTNLSALAAEARAKAVNPDAYKLSALKAVEQAALLHSTAVAKAIETTPATRPRERAVQDVLYYGARLDAAIEHALRQGLSVEALAAVYGLHPSYVESLTQPPL